MAHRGRPRRARRPAAARRPAVRAVDGRGGDDDVAILLLRLRGGPAPQAGGGFRQHVAQNDPEALCSARHAIRGTVRAWGGRERSDEIELVAGELITNALLHTDGGAVVTLRMPTAHRRRLRVEVEDRSSALPRRRDAGTADLSGRGLLLVDRLADAWGVESRGSGKCVWCEFALPGPAGADRRTRRTAGPAAPGTGPALRSGPGRARGPHRPAPPDRRTERPPYAARAARRPPTAAAPRPEGRARRTPPV